MVTGQFCWIRFHLNLTGRGKKKEKMARGVGWTGRLFEGRLLFERIGYLTSPETALKCMSVIGPFTCMET